VAAPARTRSAFGVRLGRLLTLAIVGLALLLLSGRSATPSVLLITIDALRSDRLGCYGHPTNETPAIDRLAREGMIFEHAYCDIPWTTASMSSVMTGQYGSGHGLRLPMNKLSPSAVTMAELLHARGFQTGAIIGSFPLDSVYGLDQGFETYDDEFSMPMINDPDTTVAHVESQLPEDRDTQAAFIREKFTNDAYRPDEQVTDAAIRWLDHVHDGRRFLLWVHYFGPHEKLRGDVGFVDQEPDIVAAYDPDVEASDRAVGRLLDHFRERQLLEDTLVVLHADHGQNLGEHDYVGHSTRLDEVSVRIPLIVRYPRRVAGGGRRRDIAQNVDILPTVLDATRIAELPGLAGRSLLPSYDDPLGLHVAADKQIAYFETYVSTLVYAPIAVPKIGALLGPVERHGVRTPEWKLITEDLVGPCSWGAAPSRDPFGAWTMQNPIALDAKRCAEIGQTELYHASASSPDGLETSPTQPPEVVAALKAEIQKHAVRAGEGAEGKVTLSPEQERKLRSLGYLR